MATEPGEELTERELEITALVTEGLTNREIAARLFLSHNTIKVHLRNIFTKTGVASRTELSMLAVQEGWVAVPGLVEPAATPSTDSSPLASMLDEGALDQGLELPPKPAPWPLPRWIALALGLALALFVALLPQSRQGLPATAGPGVVFGAVDPVTRPSAPVAGDGWQERTPPRAARGHGNGERRRPRLSGRWHDRYRHERPRGRLRHRIRHLARSGPAPHSPGQRQRARGWRGEFRARGM